MSSAPGHQEIILKCVFHRLDQTSITTTFGRSFRNSACPWLYQRIDKNHNNRESLSTLTTIMCMIHRGMWLVGQWTHKDRSNLQQQNLFKTTDVNSHQNLFNKMASNWKSCFNHCPAVIAESLTSPAKSQKKLTNKCSSSVGICCNKWDSFDKSVDSCTSSTKLQQGIHHWSHLKQDP